MAGMYDGVSASGIIDTAFGNYDKNSNNKSTLNSLVDAGKAVLNVPKDAYLYANDLTNRYVAQPLSDYVAGPAANYISDSMAQRDFAAEHGGQYPASPEELSAYKSLKAKDMNGALNPQPPATQAQDKQDEIQAGIQKSEQEQKDLAAQGYKQVPDAGQDPVGHISALNENKSKGVGGFSGNVNTPLPTPPTQSQTQDIQLNQQGKAAAFDQNKIPAWYKSDSFNMGLISFGLNLLSGNDLATSFGAAGQAFNDMYGSERRSYWVEDLQKQGYDPIEIDEWRRTGDSKVLTSPQEKAMKGIQQKLQMQQLDNALYEGSPEMRQYKLDQDQFDRNIKIEQMNDAKAARAESLALRREQMAASAEDRAERRQDRLDRAAAKGTEYKDALAKAENWYTRARQGYKNYEDTVRSYGGIDKVYSKNTLGQLTQGAMTDLVFSGNTTKEVAAKQLDEKFVTTVNREREFLAPLLRKDSGAAISQSEWKTTGEIYFPRPGDTPQAREQKAQSRVVAMLATNPHASGELRSAVDQYTQGNVRALKEVRGKVYAQSPQGQWFEIPQ